MRAGELVKCKSCGKGIYRPVGKRNLGSVWTYEHLHARSASRFPLLFGKYRYSEEAAVELMAEKICEKANIKYIPSYRKRTKALKQLNILLHVCDDEYDFAYFFFNIPMPERKKWIQNEVNNYIEKMKISDTDSNKVINLMKDIIGDKAL